MAIRESQRGGYKTGVLLGMAFYVVGSGRVSGGVVCEYLLLYHVTSTILGLLTFSSNGQVLMCRGCHHKPMIVERLYRTSSN